MVLYYDLQLDDDLDITFEEEVNNKSIITNALTKEGKIDISQDLSREYFLEEKGGDISNILLNNNIKENLIYDLIKKYNGNDLKQRIENEINKQLLYLKKNKIINEFKIVNIVLINNNCHIYLLINNEKLNIDF